VTVRIRVCTTLAAPPDAVWAVLEPLERHGEWMADAESIHVVTSRRRGVDTVLEVRTRVGPIRLTDLMTVTEWEPGRAMGIRHEGAVTGTGRFTLRARRRGRTRFCWEERLRFPWWLGGRVGELVGRPALRAVWKRNLRRLADLVERGA
jgi:carbon monoxide dehydrogenase subunit G